MTNTKTQEEIEKAVAEYREKVQEVRNLWDELHSKSGGDSKTVEFGFKTKRGAEIFTVPDWGNVEHFLTQKLEHLAKQKDEEFMGMLEDDKTDYSHVSNQTRPYKRAQQIYNNRLRAELRNKLQGGKE